MVTIIRAKDRPHAQGRTFLFEGQGHGSAVSFFSVDNEPGQGPVLHVHPYPETWMVISGSAVFIAGNETTEVTSNDIGVVPADTPHKYVNIGPGPLRMVCIHPSPTVIQVNLE